MSRVRGLWAVIVAVFGLASCQPQPHIKSDPEPSGGITQQRPLDAEARE